jgi:glycosyltransferase involved in cell wall biosynthesis
MRADFDEPIPATLPVGAGAILLVRGRIVSPRRARQFVVRLDDEEQRFDGHGERIFLPIVVEGTRADTRARLRIAASTRTGEELLVDQAIEFLPAARSTITIDTPIAICLATYNPDPALLARQLASLRAQSRQDWTCIIHDDGSRLERWAVIEELTRADARFRVFRSERNRGFYRNFEAALALVPSTTPYVALSDQDDRWYPDKLAACIERLDANPRAQLVYSDMRIVRSDGSVVAPTYWDRRRNNFRNLDTLLFANTVTGAASMLRGSLLDAALPFPPAQGPTFHDHWLACAAFVAGGLDYIDRPLYDYTQHDGNVIGHAGFGPLTVTGALVRHALNTLEMVLKPPKAIDNLWAMLAQYEYVYRRLQLVAATLRLRFPHLDRDVERTLALFDDRLSRAPALMLSHHLAVTRRGDTTDGSEFKLGLGLLLHKTVVPLMRPVVELRRRLRA